MGLKITNAAEKPVLWVYGEIGLDVLPEDMRAALESIPSSKDIEIRIHSPGGSYLDSIAMHTNLRRRTGHITTVVDGLAASGGSIIAMAGDRIEMAQGSWFMIHEAHGGMHGRADDFRAAAERLDATNGELLRIYSARFKGSKEDLRDAIHQETWYTTDQAMKAGFVDAECESMAIAAHADLSKFEYKNIPQPLLEAKSPFERNRRAAEILESIFTVKP